MNQLFRSRWSSQEGEILDPKKNFTTNFILWCKKTEQLTDDQWRRGFEKVEFKVSDAARQGETAWPPTYAEFVGYCTEIAEAARAHKRFNFMGLEDKTRKEERKEFGRKQASALKASLFGED